MFSFHSIIFITLYPCFYFSGVFVPLLFPYQIPSICQQITLLYQHVVTTELSLCGLSGSVSENLLSHCDFAHAVFGSFLQQFDASVKEARLVLSFTVLLSHMCVAFNIFYYVYYSFSNLHDFLDKLAPRCIETHEFSGLLVFVDYNCRMGWY